jgi:hypothetical protein
MKSRDGGSGLPGGTRLGGTKRGASSLSGAPLPLQWMDPMSWRLPSGKALAEFALQSGFLAPLWMSGPMGDGRVKRKKKVEEVPANPGRFRRNTASTTRQG